MDVAGKRVTVVGMARSGVAAVELLLEKGAMVRAMDQNPGGPVHGVTVEPQSSEPLRNADLAVVSPGVPADLDILKDAASRGVKVVGDLEFASWYLQGPVLGITGSNGKTTTTALIGHILRESGVPSQVGGNIGTPPASLVKTSRPEQWNVLELSSFQLETAETFHARTSVCLNVTPDHLDRHYTFENYSAAKRRLFELQRDGDCAVLNADDAACVSYASFTSAAPLWFSLRHPVERGMWLDGEVLRTQDAALMKAGEIPLRGRHNIENTMAAALAAHLAGATPDQIAAAVRTFPGVEHRIEFVRRVAGVEYYNDSKATNVDATLKAIDAFPRGLWIILGGKDKNSDYTPLVEPLRGKARAVLLIGAAAPKIEEQFGGALPLLQCTTLDRAVAAAHADARPGETVLLAPACASFDQFDNYEHRGKVFKQLVNQLPEKGQ